MWELRNMSVLNLVIFPNRLFFFCLDLVFHYKKQFKTLFNELVGIFLDNYVKLILIIPGKVATLVFLSAKVILPKHWTITSAIQNPKYWSQPKTM